MLILILNNKWINLGILIKDKSTHHKSFLKGIKTEIKKFYKYLEENPQVFPEVLAITGLALQIILRLLITK
jgi:hypothetical protein